jgi:hypothetical protein
MMLLVENKKCVSLLECQDKKKSMIVSLYLWAKTKKNVISI